MEIAALVVSIVAALAAVGALWYARRSDRSAAQSAAAAATTAALDLQRQARRAHAPVPDHGRTVEPGVADAPPGCVPVRAA
jgi:type II secretory pathway pseudopilin PulG